MLLAASMSCRGAQAMQPKDVFKQSSLFEPSQRSGMQQGSHTSGGQPASNGAAPDSSAAAGGDGSSCRSDAAARTAAALPAGPFSAYQQQAQQGRQPEVGCGHMCDTLVMRDKALNRTHQPSGATQLWLPGRAKLLLICFAAVCMAATNALRQCGMMSTLCCRACRAHCLRVRQSTAARRLSHTAAVPCQAAVAAAASAATGAGSPLAGAQLLVPDSCDNPGSEEWLRGKHTNHIHPANPESKLWTGH